MGIKRQARRRVCIWMAGILLLAQWLVVAYACAALGLPPLGHAVVAAPADCHGMMADANAAGNPSLCKAHCDADRVLPPQVLVDDLTVSGGFFLVSLLALEPLASQARRSDWPRSGEPPGWPPLYLIHQVLRL